MKRIAIVVLTVFLASATMPVLAQMTKEEKDQCLLASKNCLNEVDSIQKRIKRLQGEIKKGKKVYTAEELKKLQDKLNEVKEILNELEQGGSN
jgi:peptidoglycan hydrolase CwlO-like protein